MEAVRKRKTFIVRCGAGRVVQWARRTVGRYTQTRTGNGDLGSWRSFIGSDDE